MTKDIIVLYHANCLDGFTSAWAAWKKFGDNAIYIPAKHQEDPPEEVFEEGKTVYMLDFFSYSEDVIKKILKSSKKLIVIDHHISVKDMLSMADEHVFDNDESGASLSWKYFCPDEKVPFLVECVMDCDIWRHKTPNSREITKVLSLEDFEFETWEKIAGELEDGVARSRYIEIGKFLIKNSDKEVDRIMEGAVEIEFDGHKCLAANSPVNNSNVGHELFEKSGTFGLVWSHRGDKISVSLRSGEGGVDVSELAKKHGGGGHKYAAGFSFEEDGLLQLEKLFNND